MSVIQNTQLNDWYNSLPIHPYSKPYFKDEEAVVQKIKEEMDFLDLINAHNYFSKFVLEDTLAAKPRVVMFGAGGTASWFLPKLLKIFNDAFTKRPDLAYELEILVIDGDEVRI